MSLKTFHIFFIAVSMMLTLSMGVLCLRAYLSEGMLYLLSASVACGLAALALLFYGVYFLRKLKKVSFL